MSVAGDRLIEAATEALAIAKGEQPAARMHIAGYSYVPEAQLSTALARISELEKERDEARAKLQSTLRGLDAEGKAHWAAHDRAITAEASLIAAKAEIERLREALNTSQYLSGFELKQHIDAALLKANNTTGPVADDT